MGLQRIECSAIYCKPGNRPARIVIAKQESYSTYLEILVPNQEPYLALEHHGMTFDEALHDYQRRIEWLTGKPDHAKARR